MRRWRPNCRFRIRHVCRICRCIGITEVNGEHTRKHQDIHKQLYTSQDSFTRVSRSITLLLELLPAPRVSLGPDRDTLSRREEFSPPILADLDLALPPAKDVSPLLSGMLLADLDALSTLSGTVAGDDDAPIVLLVSLPEPRNAVSVVPVVDVLAVCKVLASADEVLELANWLLGVVTTAAVQVTVEDTGVTIGTEEDERVCDGLEPRGDPVLERLTDLSVVVVDEGYSVDGAGLNEGVIEDLAEVKVLASLTSLLEVALERSVEDGELGAETIEVGVKCGNRVLLSAKST